MCSCSLPSNHSQKANLPGLSRKCIRVMLPVKEVGVGVKAVGEQGQVKCRKGFKSLFCNSRDSMQNAYADF